MSAQGKPSELVCWITGAGGLIGNCLMQSATHLAPAWRVVGPSRAELDLTDSSQVCAFFTTHRPGLIIHCAAVSRSTVCQENPTLARRSNVEATTRLAELASGIPFIFFSTDLVFDGRKGHYNESDSVNPLGVYAETKAEAERIVLANSKHTVIRLSLNGGTSPTGDRGFNEQMRRAWGTGQVLRLFTDEFRCPIAATVTARAVWELALGDVPGLYHLCGSERLSRWRIGELIAARWPQLNPRIEPASIKEYKGAPRPADTSLDCARIQRLLSFGLPGLTKWLQANLREVF